MRAVLAVSPSLVIRVGRIIKYAGGGLEDNVPSLLLAPFVFWDSTPKDEDLNDVIQRPKTTTGVTAASAILSDYH